MTDIILDGSHMEGGGQIARNALALACLTGKSFYIDNIRKGRGDSGLKAQHLFCVKAAAQLCRADFTDVEIGSTSMSFFPGKLSATALDVDIGTAGSITLFLQSVLIPAMFANAPVKIRITGGTDVNWSMPFDYFKEVFIPHIKNLASFEIKLLRRGYYPKGGGEIEITVRPKFKLKNFENFAEFFDYIKKQKLNLDFAEQGKILQIKGVSHASKTLSDAKVAERQAEVAKMALKELNCPVNIAAEYSDSLSPGSGITLWAKFDSGAIIGADYLGEKGKPSEKVGKEAADNLIREIKSGAPIDSHLADNLIPFMALFGGRIKVSEITKHTLTNIYITEKFLDVKFEVDEKDKIISV